MTTRSGSLFGGLRLVGAALFCASLWACASDESDRGAPGSEAMMPPGGEIPLAVDANNAFYYYDDVEAAWAFYRDVMGFETAADYGFAKIMRFAETSYLTLVNAADGMHSTDEPKTVTLGLISDEIEGWYDYLQAQGVPVRSPIASSETNAEMTFAVEDPEGYLLEFARYNPHEENTELLPAVEAMRPWPDGEGTSREGASGLETAGEETAGSRPPELRIKGSVLWFYYEDPAAARTFYEESLGFELTADQDWAWIYQTSLSGFVGLVDGSLGLHQPTQDKAVTASFITTDLEAWSDRLQAHDFNFRTDSILSEGDMVNVFVGYDPENYFLEWDAFVDVEGNEGLGFPLVAPGGGEGR